MEKTPKKLKKNYKKNLWLFVSFIYYSCSITYLHISLLDSLVLFLVIFFGLRISYYSSMQIVNFGQMYENFFFLTLKKKKHWSSTYSSQLHAAYCSHRLVVVVVPLSPFRRTWLRHSSSSAGFPLMSIFLSIFFHSSEIRDLS